jgi:fucose 4-O-acetylase-like acetyltransferase
MRWSTLVDDVVGRTPPERDRVVDLLRVASILVVVVGHWLLAVVTVEDGRIVGDNLLAIVPATQWLTWGLQVMPVFFFVGGRVNAAGWSAAQARGQTAAAWIQRRAVRLLRPVLALVTVWTVLIVVLAGLRVGPDLLRLGSQIVLTPVWFLAVYLGVVALVPLTHAAHRRRPLGTLMAFVVAAIVVDTAQRAAVPLVGWVNYLAVWGGVHQLGYLWGDRRLVTTPRRGLVLAAACLGGLVVLTEVLGYPRSMVGVPGALETNNTPPTVALLLLAGLQVGGVVAAQAPLARWLARPAVWTTVTLLGRRALTVFLWHQTALVAVVGATFPTGLWPVTTRVDAIWWATRPLWYLALGLVLTVLVAGFGWVEQTPPTAPPRPGRWALVRVGAGIVAVVVGLSRLVLVGLYDPDGPVAVRVLPLAAVAFGSWALSVVGARRDGGDTPSRTVGSDRSVTVRGKMGVERPMEPPTPAVPGPASEGRAPTSDRRTTCAE